jgi:hypothetical protein
MSKTQKTDARFNAGLGFFYFPTALRNPRVRRFTVFIFDMP